MKYKNNFRENSPRNKNSLKLNLLVRASPKHKQSSNLKKKKNRIEIKQILLDNLNIRISHKSLYSKKQTEWSLFRKSNMNMENVCLPSR